ncbi:hypothetical protein COEREDRAFT_12104 [Coemansia reversa NRRL 1564]|uniref:Uncharacterized protein n=1 Tax=Coemansia reversa (strain ATCC 12441 / NRRL 1564) TaxID=763665 RepID=A0A2G5B2B9_COERN|nr:hypothetical protein COEREDRAFT_12104 [Coemansia reversa NRRL 1564]|eukprot:PIA12857.1 hypothetical protein COEREDRAFT_12104 [Coemansia reversa NRRL 1564]
MYINTATALIVLASSVFATPVPQPVGTLEGVVDAVAPITAGAGVTVNNLLGFRDLRNSPPADGSSGSSALLGGVVDAVAPITGGVGFI